MLDIIDHKSFAYMHDYQLHPTPFACPPHITGLENDLPFYDKYIVTLSVIFECDITPKKGSISWEIRTLMTSLCNDVIR